MTATGAYLLLRAFADELARCGVQVACTSPGSRSTPLVLSFVREPRIRCFSHIDERSAGFFAVGAARASGRAVAIACTSGTAAANLMPAVIEAHEGRIPLLVLTADRPPELREVGAGQTIDQIKLYGGAVRWFFEVGVHDSAPQRLRWIRALACRAVWTATGGRPGPVHLNFPLREPLVLGEPLPPDGSGRPGGAPWLSRLGAAARAPAAALPLPARGVVVAGGQRDRDSGAAVADFAAAAGYPLLADPLSGARHGPAAIARYDLLLRDRALAQALAPELVIRAGDLPTSKPLRAWLAGLSGARQVLFDPERAWQDPDAAVSEIVDAAVAPSLRAWAPAQPVDTAWLARWRAADAQASAAIEQALAGDLSEPLVAARLADWLPAGATLFVASSMPIRDVELFSGTRAGAPAVLANRGANGIDGTVSSAFGAAAVSDGPVVLLIGDVALAHDIGGLLCARRLALALTIVLLNNDGGGIFHFLPVSGERDAFEQHVATPHGLDFAHAAALYGLEHRRVWTAGDMRTALEASVARGTTTVIEVRTERVENLAAHRRIEAAVLAALSPPAPAASPRA